jgi:chromosome segregation ATPase
VPYGGGYGGATKVKTRAPTDPRKAVEAYTQRARISRIPTASRERISEVAAGKINAGFWDRALSPFTMLEKNIVADPLEAGIQGDWGKVARELLGGLSGVDYGVDVSKAFLGKMSKPEATKSPSSVLAAAGWKPNFVTGLGIDIGLDPITWLTLGTAAAGKVGVNAGIRAFAGATAKELTENLITHGPGYLEKIPVNYLKALERIDELHPILAGSEGVATAGGRAGVASAEYATALREGSGQLEEAIARSLSNRVYSRGISSLTEAERSSITGGVADDISKKAFKEFTKTRLNDAIEAYGGADKVDQAMAAAKKAGRFRPSGTVDEFLNVRSIARPAALRDAAYAIKFRPFTEGMATLLEERMGLGPIGLTRGQIGDTVSKVLKPVERAAKFMLGTGASDESARNWVRLVDRLVPETAAEKAGAGRKAIRKGATQVHDLFSKGAETKRGIRKGALSAVERGLGDDAELIERAGMSWADRAGTRFEVGRGSKEYAKTAYDHYVRQYIDEVNGTRNFVQRKQELANQLDRRMDDAFDGDREKGFQFLNDFMEESDDARREQILQGVRDTAGDEAADTLEHTARTLKRSNDEAYEARRFIRPEETYMESYTGHMLTPEARQMRARIFDPEFMANADHQLGLGMSRERNMREAITEINGQANAIAHAAAQTDPEIAAFLESIGGKFDYFHTNPISVAMSHSAASHSALMQDELFKSIQRMGKAMGWDEEAAAKSAGTLTEVKFPWYLHNKEKEVAKSHKKLLKLLRRKIKAEGRLEDLRAEKAAIEAGMEETRAVPRSWRRKERALERELAQVRGELKLMDADVGYTTYEGRSGMAGRAKTRTDELEEEIAWREKAADEAEAPGHVPEPSEKPRKHPDLGKIDYEDEIAWREELARKAEERHTETITVEQHVAEQEAKYLRQTKQAQEEIGDLETRVSENEAKLKGNLRKIKDERAERLKTGDEAKHKASHERVTELRAQVEETRQSLSKDKARLRRLWAKRDADIAEIRKPLEEAEQAVDEVAPAAAEPELAPHEQAYLDAVQEHTDTVKAKKKAQSKARKATKVAEEHDASVVAEQERLDALDSDAPGYADRKRQSNYRIRRSKDAAKRQRARAKAAEAEVAEHQAKLDEAASGTGWEPGMPPPGEAPAAAAPKAKKGPTEAAVQKAIDEANAAIDEYNAMPKHGTEAEVIATGQAGQKAQRLSEKAQALIDDFMGEARYEEAAKGTPAAPVDTAIPPPHDRAVTEEALANDPALVEARSKAEKARAKADAAEDKLNDIEDTDSARYEKAEARHEELSGEATELEDQVEEMESELVDLGKTTAAEEFMAWVNDLPPEHRDMAKDLHAARVEADKAQDAVDAASAPLEATMRREAEQAAREGSETFQRYSIRGGGSEAAKERAAKNRSFLEGEFRRAERDRDRAVREAERLEKQLKAALGGSAAEAAEAGPTPPPHPGAATGMQTEEVVVRVPKTFYDDHVARSDFPTGTIEKDLKRAYEVRMTRAQYENLLSDARYYASAKPGEMDVPRGTIASAGATQRALEKVPAPTLGPSHADVESELVARLSGAADEVPPAAAEAPEEAAAVGEPRTVEVTRGEPDTEIAAQQRALAEEFRRQQALSQMTNPEAAASQRQVADDLRSQIPEPPPNKVKVRNRRQRRYQALTEREAEVKAELKQARKDRRTWSHGYEAEVDAEGAPAVEHKLSRKTERAVQRATERGEKAFTKELTKQLGKVDERTAKIDRQIIKIEERLAAHEAETEHLGNILHGTKADPVGVGLRQETARVARVAKLNAETLEKQAKVAEAEAARQQNIVAVTQQYHTAAHDFRGKLSELPSKFERDMAGADPETVNRVIEQQKAGVVNTEAGRAKLLTKAQDDFDKARIEAEHLRAAADDAKQVADDAEAAAQEAVGGIDEAVESAMRLGPNDKPVRPGEGTRPQGWQNAPTYAPPEIAKMVEAMVEVQKDPTLVLGLYRKLMGLWKGLATSVVPFSTGFTSRNMLGNVFNAYLSGVRDWRVFKRSYKIYKELSKSLDELGEIDDVEELMRRVGGDLRQSNLSPAEQATALAALRRGVIGSSGLMGAKDLPHQVAGAARSVTGIEKNMQVGVRDTVGQRVADALGGGRLGRAGKKVTKAVTQPIRTGMEFNSMVEDVSKLAVMLDAADKGADLGAAAMHARVSMVDYDDLTPFEEKYMRNSGLIPFYSWLRKESGLMAGWAMTQPSFFHKIQQIQDQTWQQWGPTGAEANWIPSYYRELGFPLPPGLLDKLDFLPGDVDQLRFLAPDLPFFGVGEAAQGLAAGNFSQLASNLGPAFQTPLSLLARRNLFTEAPLDERGKPANFALAQTIGRVPGLREAVGILPTKEGGSSQSARSEFVWEQILPILAKYRTLAPTSDSDKDKQMRRLLSMTFGIGTMPFTEQTQKNEAYRRLDAIQQLVNTLEAQGYELAPRKAGRKAGSGGYR